MYASLHQPAATCNYLQRPATRASRTAGLGANPAEQRVGWLLVLAAGCSE